MGLSLCAKKPAKVRYQPLDGGYGWVVVAGAALTHFLLVGMARCLGVIYELLKDKYSGTASKTAVVASLFNTTRTLIAPICGMLCDRIGNRQVAFIGALILPAGLVISAFSTGVFYMYFSFGILTGIGGAMVFTPAYITVGQYFDKDKGKAMGLATVGSGLGNVVLAPLINFLADFYGFFGAVLLLGGIQLHNLLAALTYRPISQMSKPVSNDSNIVQKEAPNDKDVIQANDNGDTKQSISKDDVTGNEKSIMLDKEISSENGKGDTGSGITDSKIDSCTGDVAKTALTGITGDVAKTAIAEDKQSDNTNTQNVINGGLSDALVIIDDQLDSGIRSDQDSESSQKKTCKCFRCSKNSLLRNVTFLLYGILIMQMQVCIMTYLVFIPGLAKELGADDTKAAMVLSIFGFCDMGGRFLWGFIMDIKPICYNRRQCFCALAFMFGCCAICTGLMPSYIGVATMAGVTAIFEGGTHSQRMTVLSEFVSPLQMSSATGFVIFFQGIGNIYGPTIGGLLRDNTDTNAYGLIFCGTCMASGAILFVAEYFVRKKCCKG